MHHPDPVDLSKPVAVILPESTATVHDIINKSAEVRWLMRGELDRDEYVRYLMMLHCVYEYVLFTVHVTLSITLFMTWITLSHKSLERALDKNQPIRSSNPSIILLS